MRRLTFSSFLTGLGLAAGLCTGSLLPAPATAQASWNALPGDTVLAFRMPETRGMIADLRQNTAAGQLLFTPERIEAVMQMIKQENGEDWEEFQQELEAYGLTTQDLLNIVQSEWSLGFVASPRREEQLPRMQLLFSADLPEEKIDQIYGAFEHGAEENADNDELRRLNFELGGVEVQQYSIADMGMDREADWSMPDGFETMTDEQIDEHWKKVEEENDKAQWAKIDETHLLLTRMPGRFVLAVGLPQSKEAIRQMIADQQEIDWDSATDVESVQATLAQYVAAMDGGAEEGLAAQVSANAGAASILGNDNTLFEFAADLPQAIELISLGIRLEENAEDAEQFRQVMSALGLDDLGLATGSGYFADNALQYRTFAGMSAPRSGLLGTLDGQTLPAGPPAWVPQGVTYFHLAYDLSKLYDVVVQMVAELGGDEAMQSVQMGNMMVQGYAQADIPTILRSLGTRHSVILLEGREVTRQVEEWDFEAEEFKEVERTTYMRPGAVVWDLADGEVWNRVMGALKNFAAMAGGTEGGVAAVDEQGFTGLRLDEGEFPAALMLGQNKLMFGFGDDVSARTLSLLNNPPQGGNGMAEGSIIAEGAKLIDYRENILFVIQDGGDDMVSTKRQLMSALESEDSNMDEQQIAQIKELVPSDEELRASFGVSVGQVYLTDDGLIYEGAAALPAAE